MTRGRRSETTPNEAEPEGRERPPPAKARRVFSSGVFALVLSVLFGLVLAEAAVRSFWWFEYGVPLTDPGKILYAYYPELEGPELAGPSRTDEFFDVLILGGSVLNRGWSAVEQQLLERLADRGRRRVRIFNLAEPSHTSRDSWLKYRALSDARFELVVIYNGINEVRANNAPPDVFREDYGHYAWYDAVHALAPSHGTARFALPYTLRWLAARVRASLSPDRHVPPDDPREDWLVYGRDIRSARSLSRNLESILELANERGDPVLLMTFATFVPDDYSREAFLEKRLGYGLHFTPIEMWGLPENVVRGVASHNQVIRDLAVRFGTMFVDQAQLMDDIAYFNDICHLTTVGSVRFANNMMDDPGGIGRLLAGP